MKKVKTLVLLMLASAGFAFAQDITVQGEKKVNTDFKKYKSFNWITNDQPGTKLVEYTYEEFVPVTTEKVDKKGKAKKNKDVVVYSYSFIVPAADSSINNAAIRSVQEELEGRGYRKDAINPDFLVAYKIFDRSTQIKGYNAPPTEAGPSEVHQPKDTVTYALKPGTVLVSLIDAKTSEVIWEGYASGVARKDDIINDRQRVKQAVNLIFKKFEFRGDKYSMR